MPANIVEIRPGELFRTLCERTRLAVACGALHSIDTRSERVEQDGATFVVRVAESLRRKRIEMSRRDAEREHDPFSPPEPELTVGDLSDTHIGVLNKFNVVPHHLLIVTRTFADQEQLLTRTDFETLSRCLAEYPALAFYNGGRIAGASQRHKHLQVVPIPLHEGERELPFDALFASVPERMGIGRVERLRFVHAFCRLPAALWKDSPALARHAEARYREMLDATGIPIVDGTGGERQGRPYNLLATREWMLLVPRSKETSHGISINGLGYAGSLFVANRNALEDVRRAGPMSILEDVSAPL